jgi:integral membrane sensor domain MASE1
MIVVEALMGACFFAAIVAVLCVPWMGTDEPHQDHH